jgi:hypothetical protein
MRHLCWKSQELVVIEGRSGFDNLEHPGRNDFHSFKPKKLPVWCNFIFVYRAIHRTSYISTKSTDAVTFALNIKIFISAIQGRSQLSRSEVFILRASGYLFYISIMCNNTKRNGQRIKCLRFHAYLTSMALHSCNIYKCSSTSPNQAHRIWCPEKAAVLITD